LKIMSMSELSPVSAAQLGQLLALTDRHVRRLRRDGVFPGVGSQYDLKLCVPAYVRMLRDGAVAGDLATEKLLKVRAQRRALEMANALKAGRLIHADLVEETLMSQAAYLAQSHDAVAGRLANEMLNLTDPGIARAKLLFEMREIRNGLAEHGLRMAADIDQLADELERKEKAAKARGER